MPTSSAYPTLTIPDVGLWDFLFERKTKDFSDDKSIYLDPATNRSYTFAQTKQAASDFGTGLRALWDWHKGDVLGLYAPNSIDTPVVTWGCHFAGGVLSPANPGYTVDELAFQLKDSGAKALVAQLAVLKTALAACERVGIPEDRVILMGGERDESGRFKHFTDVRSISGTQRYRRVKVDPAKDLAFLVYSSGQSEDIPSRNAYEQSRSCAWYRRASQIIQEVSGSRFQGLG
jgi:4-coumarate--CoA ligase